MLMLRLLGPPAIERDGQPLRSPRGRKAWALLSYVLLAERPPSRRYLAEMLFGDADDPLGALRWTLAELRRALGNPLALRGDPVVAALEPDAVVDIYLVTREYADTSPLLDIAGELLDGMTSHPARRSSRGCWSSGTGFRPCSRPASGRRQSRCWPPVARARPSRTPHVRWPATPWTKAITSCW